MSTQVHEQERELHQQIAGEVGVALPDIEVLAVELNGRERMCVYIDSPHGVDHALCERVTNLLRGYLDRYSLEVSSPGPERPLRTPSHFAGALGRRVAIRTAVEVGGRRRLRGEVVEAGEEELVLASPGGDRVRVPYDVVTRGNLIDEGR